MICYGDQCSTWWAYGRWVIIIIVVALIVIIISALIRKQSIRRVNNGQAPLYGTAWLTPRGQPQQQQQGYPMYGYPGPQAQQPYPNTGTGPSGYPMEDPKQFVPPYHEYLSPNDAGYYDQNGNFVTNQNSYYTGVFNTSDNRLGSSTFSPPPGPPPGVDNFAPPPGPPPDITTNNEPSSSTSNPAANSNTNNNTNNSVNKPDPAHLV